MSQINPYDSPQFVEPLPNQATPAPTVGDAGGLWRDGNLLVMHKQAKLPPVCIKSNQPIDGNRWLKRNLSWHPQHVYFTLLICLLMYLVMALLLQKKATIYVGLSDAWWARRRRAMWIGWLSFFSAVGLFILAAALVNEHDWAEWLQLGSIIGGLIGIIYGVTSARMVSASRITNNYVYLNGVSRDLLATLPPWPRYE